MKQVGAVIFTTLKLLIASEKSVYEKSSTTFVEYKNFNEQVASLFIGHRQNRVTLIEYRMGFFSNVFEPQILLKPFFLIAMIFFQKHKLPT